MPFEKGREKTGGRKKGSLNRRTEELLDKCERLNIDPFEALLELARPENELNIRLGALKEICQYLYAKKKSVEHSGEVGRPLADKSDEEVKELVLRNLNAK